jgi:hypothetical protein
MVGSMNASRCKRWLAGGHFKRAATAVATTLLHRCQASRLHSLITALMQEITNPHRKKGRVKPETVRNATRTQGRPCLAPACVLLFCA